GMHLRYRCTGAVIPGNMKLAEEYETDERGEILLDDKGKPKKVTLIETRGDGGMAIAPGSPPECHPSGRVCENPRGPPLTALPDLTPEERQILLDAARSFHRATDDVSAPDKAAANGRLTPGDDYSARGPDWEEIIGPDGWKEVRKQGSVRYWRR